MSGWRGLLHQLARFVVGSGLGLVVDLSVFAGGVALGAPPWAANLVSASCAVVVVYLFVTKYAFGSGRSRTSFLLFVGWYALSIIAFSVFIDLLHDGTGWAPFVCKLVSLPPSFAANFVVSRLLLHRRSVAGSIGVAGAGRRPVGASLPGGTIRDGEGDGT